MKKQLKEKYNSLSPMGKKIARALGAVLVVVVLYGILGQILFPGKKIQDDGEKTLIRKSLVEEDSILSEKMVLDKDIKDLNDRLSVELSDYRKELEELKNQNEVLMNYIDYLSSTINRKPSADSGTDSGTDSADDTGAGGYPSHGYPSYEGGYPQPEGGYSGYPSARQPGAEVAVSYLGGVRRINMGAADRLPAGNKDGVKQNYFPTTSYFKGVLLNGLYAPTLSKGKSTPHPAFIRVTDLSVLPNDLRKDISGCEFMGLASGEMSDSRVHIQITALACTAHDGSSYLDTNVSGVVFGEDGTLGVPGEILANFNKLLLHSFFMESLAGLGNAIKSASGTTVVNSDGGVIDTVEGSDEERFRKIMVASGGEGLGKGFELISEFYLSMLKEMVPVIKINGGRDVEVKLTRGVELKLMDNNWSWGNI